MSDLAEVIGVKREDVSFGLTLREVTRRVVGFRISFSAVIIKIENLTDDEGIVSPDSDDHITSNCYVFHLIDGEYLTKVLYSTRSDEEAIQRIKFVTNFRSSEWVGQTRGVSMEIRSIEAPVGYGIHSLCGRSFTFLRTLAIETLGAIVWKDPQGQWAVEASVPMAVQSTDNDSKGSRKFQYASHNVGAVLVTAGDQVNGICVVSSYEVDRYAAVEDWVNTSRKDHILKLISGEQLQMVEYTTANPHIVTLRFITTHRTTPWYGGRSTDPIKTIGNTTHRGKIVCGFCGLTDEENALTELGAILVSSNEKTEIRSDTTSGTKGKAIDSISVVD